MSKVSAVEEGMVRLGSAFANEIGFTPDLFEGYGWVKDGAFYVSLIISLHPGQGNFRTMVDRVLAKGLTVKVPTPSARMRGICQRSGFQRSTEYAPVMGEYDVLVKKPDEAYVATRPLT
jgi:hypothetical protein